MKKKSAAIALFDAAVNYARAKMDVDVKQTSKREAEWNRQCDNLEEAAMRFFKEMVKAGFTVERKSRAARRAGR